MKKLPNIFQNEFNRNIKNNKEIAYVKEEKNDIDEINNIINLLFNGTTYAYNIPIIIKTNNATYNTSLISRTKTTIMTLDNNIIPINEIISIERKKF